MYWWREIPRCDAFNITKGDFQRWENLWPNLAEFFQLPCASPQRIPLTLFMSGKEPVWREIVAKHGLLDYPYRDVASWGFGEALFNIEYDIMSSTTKARQFGFHEVIDSQEMLLRQFKQFREMRFNP